MNDMRLNTTEAAAWERLRNAVGELNVAAYSAAKAARIALPNSPFAAQLKAMALDSDKMVDGL